MRRWIGIGIVALLGAGSLVALFSNGRNEQDGSKATSAGDASIARSAQPAAGLDQAKVAATSGASASSAERQRSLTAAPADIGAPGIPAASDRVVKHATLDLAIKATLLDGQFAKAQSIAAFLGGFVERSDQSRGLASITVRVPVAQFDAAIKQLSNLGRVTDRSERGDDVSAQFTDLEARVRNLSAQEGVLQDLMRQARTIPDTISVQQQLSAVRQEIEQLTGQRNLLDNQTSFATVSATLHARGVVPGPAGDGRSTIAEAWHNAIGVSVAIIGGTIVVLGAVIPLGILAAVAGAGWVLIRRRRVGVNPAGV